MDSKVRFTPELAAQVAESDTSGTAAASVAAAPVSLARPPRDVPRRLTHTREVVCRGYEREDGLWEIEGSLLDTKTYPFHTVHRGHIPAGEGIHRMTLHLTVDDELVIRDAWTRTEQSPYRVCGGVNAAYEGLIGLRIGPGFTRRVKEMFAGVKGCTHLTELLGPVATTAFQTIWPLLAERREAAGQGLSGEEKPPLVDGCHALSRDGEVVAMRWSAEVRARW